MALNNLFGGIFSGGAKPQASAQPSQGLFGGDPQSQMMLGLSLMNAGGPSLTPNSGFEGVPQTIAVLQRQNMLKQEQQRKEQARTATAEALGGLPGMNSELAQANPNLALDLWKSQQPKQTKPTEKEQAIRAYMANGMSRQDAERWAYGIYKTTQSPVTGDFSIHNKLTNTLIPVDYAQVEGEIPATPEGLTLYEQADDATGVASTIGRGVANTLGQTGADMFQAPKQTKAASEMDLFKRDLIRSMSLNPRYPVAEMQRIEGLIPTGPLTSGETLKTRLRALDQELDRIEQDTAIGMRDRTATVERRNQDRQTNRAVKLARQRLGIQGMGAEEEAPSGSAIDDLVRKHGG